MWKPKKAQPTIVRTPLPSQLAAQAAVDADAADAPLPDSPFLRAENEDDDGYDPYSDRREENPLFESNPWD